MSNFDRNLGELAGHDIVLWRDAGLDPRAAVDDDGGDRLRSVAVRAAAWAKGMCRRLDFGAGPDARRTSRPFRHARADHAQPRPDNSAVH